MAEDWFNNPEILAWAEKALEDLVPKLRASALTVSIVPTEGSVGDIKFAVELGLSIMFDKPIILAVEPGLPIPEHLARVADEIVELGDGAQDSLYAAMQRLLPDKDDD